MEETIGLAKGYAEGGDQNRRSKHPDHTQLNKLCKEFLCGLQCGTLLIVPGVALCDPAPHQTGPLDNVIYRED